MRDGGVVRARASRAHILAIDSVAEAALAEAGMGWGDVDAVAVTQGPGLKGSLLVARASTPWGARALESRLCQRTHLAGHLAVLAETSEAPPALPLRRAGRGATRAHRRVWLRTIERARPNTG